MVPKERADYRKVGGVMTKYEQVLQVRREVKAQTNKGYKADTKKVKCESLPRYIKDNPYYP
jgi:hypothetical protein